ncbi:peptidoglycan/LPS O-acetylase OafA/YrhL [Arthrobacter silviterrae]|uniref:Acyltransferase n=1 Tax=Arthrobacter silviterrae TaxID=2026658 RepID=A0ABX0D9D0_9MICC|nr:acyltransferase [Arthrobacter silviterrae]MDQ0279301.1 peptidoglycan/LPS O-acetylase OafA/YrhL [Arthrobacter silviterrae]NGN83494.1 acyltransferase [Arthrobacter silviterrae]
MARHIYRSGLPANFGTIGSNQDFLRGSMTQSRVSTIQALTGIRILAALWVVAEHFGSVLMGLFPGADRASVMINSGYLGVEVFFILSGFIISHNYAERFQNLSFAGYKEFIQKRIARLYPVHILTLGAAGAFVLGASVLHIDLNSSEKYDTRSFIMNIFMMQSIPPAQAWNNPAWSISAEFGAYILFPLFIVAVMRVKSKSWLLGLSGAAMMLVVVGMQYLEIKYEFSPTGYLGIWLRIFGEFTAGCFLWRFWKLGCKPSKRYDLLALTGLVGIVAIILWSNGVGARNFLVLPFIGIVILGCAGAVGPVRVFLSSRFMDFGGRISYSLYMVHFLVLMVGGKILPWTHFVSSNWIIRLIILLTYYVTSLATAVVVYKLVEEPGRKFISGFSKRGVRSANTILSENHASDA